MPFWQLTPIRCNNWVLKVTHQFIFRRFIWRHVFKFCFSSSNIKLALMILCYRDSSCNLTCSTSLYFFLIPLRKKYKEMEDLRKQEESRKHRIIKANFILLLLKQNLKTCLHMNLQKMNLWVTLRTQLLIYASGRGLWREPTTWSLKPILTKILFSKKRLETY